MAIKKEARENKFDGIVSELKAQEEVSRAK